MAASFCWEGWRLAENRAYSVAAVQPSQLFDFGDVAPGESRRHTFSVRNSSNVAVEIARVVVECGCMKVPKKLKGKKIAPAESVAVPVTWKVGEAEGPTEKRVFVVFRDRVLSPWCVAIKARVKVRKP